MKKVLKNKKAFTLTEMIVVIAIIGILAGVLIPTITGYIKRANQSAATQEATAMYQVYDTYQTELNSGLIVEGTLFKDYYEDIAGEVLSEDTAYIEYEEVSEDTAGEPENFIYVKGNFAVVISLADKSQKVVDVDYVDDLSSDLLLDLASEVKQTTTN